MLIELTPGEMMRALHIAKLRLAISLPAGGVGGDYAVAQSELTRLENHVLAVKGELVAGRGLGIELPHLEAECAQGALPPDDIIFAAAKIDVKTAQRPERNLFVERESARHQTDWYLSIFPHDNDWRDSRFWIDGWFRAKKLHATPLRSHFNRKRLPKPCYIAMREQLKRPFERGRDALLMTRARRQTNEQWLTECFPDE